MNYILIVVTLISILPSSITLLSRWDIRNYINSKDVNTTDLINYKNMIKLYNNKDLDYQDDYERLLLRSRFPSFNVKLINNDFRVITTKLKKIIVQNNTQLTTNNTGQYKCYVINKQREWFSQNMLVCTLRLSLNYSDYTLMLSLLLYVSKDMQPYINVRLIDGSKSSCPISDLIIVYNDFVCSLDPYRTNSIPTIFVSERCKLYDHLSIAFFKRLGADLLIQSKYRNNTFDIMNNNIEKDSLYLFSILPSLTLHITSNMRDSVLIPYSKFMSINGNTTIIYKDEINPYINHRGNLSEFDLSVLKCATESNTRGRVP